MSLKNYLEKGKLRRVKPKSDQVIRLIKRAKKDLDTAEYNLDVDPEWAFTIAYHSMLRVARALLLSNGLRVSGEAQHRTAVEVSEILLGENFSELIDKFDRMRRTRSDFIYEYVELSLEQSQEAIRSAKEMVSKIEQRIVKSRR